MVVFLSTLHKLYTLTRPKVFEHQKNASKKIRQEMTGSPRMALSEAWKGVSCRNEKKNREKLVSVQALPLVVWRPGKYMSTFNNFAHIPWEDGPPKLPPKPPKKDFLQKLLVKHPGYLRGGPCGWDLRHIFVAPIPSRLLIFEKILRFSGIFFAKSSLRKWKNVQQNPDMTFLHNLGHGLSWSPIQLSNTITLPKTNITPAGTTGPKRKLIWTNPSDSGASC